MPCASSCDHVRERGDGIFGKPCTLLVGIVLDLLAISIKYEYDICSLCSCLHHWFMKLLLHSIIIYNMITMFFLLFYGLNVAKIVQLFNKF